MTIRKLLTRCGATLPLTGAEYRRVVVSRGIARAQSQLAACDPRRLRGHRDHHDCVKHADDGAGCASNEPPFSPSIAKKVGHLDLEKSAKAPVVGLTFASGVRGQPDRGSRRLRVLRTRDPIQRLHLLGAAKRVERVGSDAGVVLGPRMPSS